MQTERKLKICKILSLHGSAEDESHLLHDAVSFIDRQQRFEELAACDCTYQAVINLEAASSPEMLVTTVYRIRRKPKIGYV